MTKSFVLWIKGNKVHLVQTGDNVEQGPKHNIPMQKQGRRNKDKVHIFRTGDDVMRGLVHNVPMQRQGSRNKDMLSGNRAEPDASPLQWIKGNKGHLV